MSHSQSRLNYQLPRKLEWTLFHCENLVLTGSSSSGVSVFGVPVFGEQLRCVGVSFFGQLNARAAQSMLGPDGSLLGQKITILFLPFMLRS